MAFSRMTTNENKSPSLHERRFFVYVLLDPKSKAIRYVGMTRNPKRRRWEHTRQEYQWPRTKVQTWTVAMVKAGTPAIFRVVCEIEGHSQYVGTNSVFHADTAARRTERQMILQCRQAGCDLLNTEILQGTNGCNAQPTT